MAFFEVGDFCRVEEYLGGISKRVSETSLRAEDLYTLMIRLADSDREAAKQTVRMLEVERKAGITIVRFAFLDEDLRDGWATTERVKNDLVHGFEETIFRDHETGAAFDIDQAYFKDYFDDQFSDLLAESDSLSVVG